MKQMILLKDLLIVLNNYQKEELILRNGINFVFESVGLLSYHIHKTRKEEIHTLSLLSG